MIGKIYGWIVVEKTDRYKVCAYISNIIIEVVILTALISILFVFSGFDKEIIMYTFKIEKWIAVFLIILGYILRRIYAFTNHKFVGVLCKKYH